MNQGEHCSLSIAGRCLVISDRPTDVILRWMLVDRLSSELNHWNHHESRLLSSPKRREETNKSSFMVNESHDALMHWQTYVVPNNSSRILPLIMYTISSSSRLLLLLLLRI